MAKSYPTTSAPYVSARLRKAGFGIVGGDRRRDGIRVSRGILGQVSVDVDIIDAKMEAALAQLVAEELATWEGYTIRRVDNHFYVGKAADQ